ncbi:hypothetical protein JRO89_XS08G0217300 [Xanthoceras sorbifolium]|uniref:Condensin-2 complex subunit G2 n=1 Tax=Xanthoceras sorbifolium TaxID=99658 RepID=A0ABQ8HQW9_9ROSI|nr:hypothetical protein JRO89_XS08G0217300 [Xanthoceras sorbifolium]
MEKRLRSSLQSSTEEFLVSATKLTLKSAKQTLKTLIHSITQSSNLTKTLPLSLYNSISHSIELLQNERLADPAKSPPTKRLRRSSRTGKSTSNNSDNNDNVTARKESVLENLQIYSLVAQLCVIHPKHVFSPSDLLPAVQLLHDNLILFESDLVLSLEVANLCESWWRDDLEGKEMLISQFLPLLVSRSLTLKKKVDVHRVYVLRDAFALFDFDDESIEDLKLLLIRCMISPLYLKTEDGRKFLAFICGLSQQVLKEVLAMIKSQIPFGRKSMLEAYGEVLFRAWKVVEEGFRKEIEDGFLQGLVEGAIHASSKGLAASIRRVLGGFMNQRTFDGVEKLLFKLAEPVIFRSLQVANSNVRQNSLHLLLDFFPLEDPDSTKELKDTLLDKQFFLLEKLLMDDFPDVRIVAVEGCCRILHLFWEIIPSSTITKILTKIIDDISHDICNEVRLSTLNGIIYLLGNPLSHEVLKVLLPRLRHLIVDSVLSVRLAVADLLLLLRDIRTFQFNKVAGLDVLLSTLANDHSQVAQKITRLLMPSYFPSKMNIEEACNRCVSLMKRSPMAGARFCEFVLSEGASLKSLMELVRVFISLVLSNNKLDTDQIEGFLVGVANLCNSLASEPCYMNALKELFPCSKVKCLFAAASTGRGQSSIFDIVSIISPNNVVGLLDDCMGLVSNCGGISEDLERQAEVRSAHKLFLSCNAFNVMFEALTKLLQKVAYRCHVKFDTEIPKQSASSTKRKKSKSSVKVSAKWKHVSGRKSSSFEEDYSMAVGVAWQMKDLLLSEDSRKAVLGSESLELSFLALKVISEVMEAPKKSDPPLTQYDTVRKLSVLDLAMDHLLNCTEQLFGAGDSGKSGTLSADPEHDQSKMAQSCGKRIRESQRDASSSSDGGSVYTRQKITLNKMKMLTAVLKFIVDSTAMGFFSDFRGRCLKFTLVYIQYIISALGKQYSDKLQIKDEDLKEIFVCLKSSFSYAAKLLNLVLRDSSKSSPPPTEASDLANDLLDLIVSIELYMSPGYAARFIVAAKPWLSDLILALGSACIFNECRTEGTYVTTSDRIKLHFPSWLLILAKTELNEISNVHSQEDRNGVSEPEQYPEFKKLMGMIVSLLKGNRSVLDAVGVIFLSSSMVGLERKDFGLVLGLLHFVCVKLVGVDDREWTGLDMMLVSLPDIYPQIEKETEEQSQEDERMALDGVRVLLEPVWMYHVYETERFSMMEDEMES